MVRDYELMYIARPELDDEGLQAATDSVERLISGVGGTVVRSTSWGRRRLAYEVDHLRDGHYMLLHIRVEGGRVAEIERALAIHETVFRHLLVLHEAGADVEVEAPDDVAAETGAGASDEEAGEGAVAAPSRQAVVAAQDEDDDEDDADDEGDQPAAVLAATEEEN